MNPEQELKEALERREELLLCGANDENLNDRIKELNKLVIYQKMEHENRSNEKIESIEFIYTQQKLLKAKEDYYVHNLPTLTDFQYDMLEQQSYKLAKELGFRANNFLGPENNEKHHIHWMIGYSLNSTYKDYKLLLE